MHILNQSNAGIAIALGRVLQEEGHLNVLDHIIHRSLQMRGLCAYVNKKLFLTKKRKQVHLR